MTRRFWAFTLAETLIVMGIIGVVAALTVPNLNASTGEKEKVAKVKKIYKDLNDALGRVISVYGPLDELVASETQESKRATKLAQRMFDFIKVTKDCGYDVSSTNTACMNRNSWKSGSTTAQMSAAYQFISADGTSFSITQENTGMVLIVFDIDGPTKGKNKYSYDQFFVKFDKNLNLQIYSNTTGNIDNYNDDLNSLSDWYLPWILKNDNMDYLKVDSNKKCPNGVILNWENNTSCK